MSTIPEIGRITIIEDYLNYWISNSATNSAITLNGNSVQTGSIYSIFDHRSSTSVILSTNGDTTSFQIYGNGSGGFSDNMMVYMEGDNLVGCDLRFAFYDASSDDINADPVLNCTADGEYVIPTGNIAVAESTGSISNIKGVIFDHTTSAGSYGDNLDLRILHLGRKFQLPYEAVANITYDKKYNNKINKSLGGNTYSTLLERESGRTIKMSWEHMDWADNSNGVNRFISNGGSLDWTYGSHIPVLIQLTDATPITEEHFIFARIMSINISQTSPHLWKVSAVFEEII